MSEQQRILLGIAPVMQANRYRDLLAVQGVAIEIIYNESTCKTGCSHTMELWADPNDLTSIREFMAKEESRNYQGLDFDPSLLEQTYDPTKATAQCPACGTVFSTTASECPDCGLFFSLPE